MPELQAENSQRNLKTHQGETNPIKVDFTVSTTSIAGQGGTLTKNAKKSGMQENTTVE